LTHIQRNTLLQQLNTGINGAQIHNIGREAARADYYCGYLADVHFIDGQALDPSSFGEFDTNGVWQPIDTTVRTLTTETITVNNKLEIYTNNYNSQTITLNINGQNYVNINDASNEWTTVPFTGTMSGTTTIVRSAGSAALYAVRVDGVTLIDGDTANIGLKRQPRRLPH
jgi:hypothetical protein